MMVVSASWLAEHAGDPDLVVADVRWALSGPSGRERYDRGHVPGAHFVDLDRDLAAPPGAGPGRHPLPDPDHFSRVLSRIGVRRGSRVVGYDDAGGAIAARLWWLLRYFGVGGGAILDGGIEAHIAAGGALTATEPPSVDAARLSLEPQPDMIVDADMVETLRRDRRALLLDARAEARYEGREEPIDPRPGHIPGARSAPYAGNLVGGRLRPRDELEARYAGLGLPTAETVVAYCGSGVTACHDLFTLSLLGRDDAKLYPGSWSDWSATARRPAALGSDPGGPTTRAPR